MRLFLISVLFLFSAVSFGQTDQTQPVNSHDYIHGQDSLWLSNIEELTLPEIFKSQELPYAIDNSALPYFRPIFNQTGASCGQAAGIAYNFTYEMCRKRNISADQLINQFPSHFAYNFMNYNGYYGVNYMHSFEILRTLGTPNVEEYGGIAIDDGLIWISGYETYYNAMRNRIRSVKKINVGTPEGLLTLKHWLAHHLENASSGGVANFNAASPWSMVTLLEGTPEGGNKAVAQFPGNYATHAMTIVGYNDSIRYDYNNDGQYTNHLDINDDGVIDMKDWEIGALKFANSYGDLWANSGYCYMMYQTLAKNVYFGGIWNHQVNVIDVKETYEPLLTIKLTMKHNMREQLRIVAGVSSDTVSAIPEHLLYFPVFNYQGGPQYMQGGNSDESNKTIEIGLDISPLLSFIQPGQQSDFYLEIHENDPQSQGAGEIIQFSVMDYCQDIPVEVVFSEQNIPLVNNDITRLHIQHQSEFEKVNITTEQIPLFDAGFQIEADGGSSPYNWEMVTPFHQQFFESSYPEIEGTQLELEAPNYKFARLELEFNFPFYGEEYNELYVHRDGFIMFEPSIYPWPYYKDTYLLFRTVKNISAFLFTPVKYYPGTKEGEGIWYEGNSDSAIIRWKQPLAYYDETIGFGDFAVKLFADGTIEYYFNNILVDENVLWYSGVSAGNNETYKLIGSSNTTALPDFQSCRLLPEKIPAGLTLDDNGFLMGISQNLNQISNLTIKVTDDRGTSDQKVLQFSDGLRFEYSLTPTDQQTVHNGSEVSMDLTILNASANEITDLNVQLSTNDPFLQITDGEVFAGAIDANAEIHLESAFSFTIAQDCPDRHTLLADLLFQSSMGSRIGTISIEISASKILMTNWEVDDGDNNKLDPGETAPLIIQLRNLGHLLSENVTASLTSNDEYLTIHQAVQQMYGNMQPGAVQSKSYSVSVASQCPVQHEAVFSLNITDAGGNQWVSSFVAKIGQYPLLIFNKAKNDLSASAIIQVIDSLQIDYVYVETLPEVLTNYRTILICLGTYYTYTSLSNAEGLQLAEYLTLGGNIYMEGTITWGQNTAVHSKFGLVVQNYPSMLSFTSLQGIDNTLAAGITADFDGAYPFLINRMAPVLNAFPVIRTDIAEDSYTMIANETANYKSIGSLLEFGSFGGINDFEKRKSLMTGILAFFDLGYLLVSFPDESDIKTESSIRIVASPNPFSEAIDFNIFGSKNETKTMYIFNAEGKLISTLQRPGVIDINNLSFRWDGKNLNGRIAPSGVYYAKIMSSGAVSTLKIIKM
jgi:hypothetical protein